MDVIIEGFRIGVEQMTLLEAVAVFFGLLSVWYAKKEKILVFPTGIISVTIYVKICFGAKLYADMSINAYYFIMSIYGWYVWAKKTDTANHIPIASNNKTENSSSLLILLLSYFVLSFLLENYTDSDVPHWDAVTTSFAFTAMWLMAKKKIENWIAWIITDLISIPLYFYKGYILTSFQFLVFLALAIAGYFSWRQKLATLKNEEN
ncbi:nicotinamide riboside transporter PnuC [Reichenbachiella sp. MALMAid0571]|uniref:nicotinamide riboside transporter PnuC n=1 Tax=Reichenbachiella sp. MALMAid0571 TaxID=3143939 RepID=UPI0032DF9024